MKKNLPILILLVVMGQIGVDLYIPSFPAMAYQFQVSIGMVQLSLTIFLLSMAFSQLLYGGLTDAYGRRKIIFPALLLCIASSILSLIASNIYLFLFARLLAGLGAGGCVVIARAVARDCYEGKHLATVSSYLSIAWALVPMIAPVLGGVIQVELNWHWNFIVLLGFSLLIFSLVFSFLKETKTSPNTNFQLHSFFGNFKSLLKNRSYVGYFLPPALFFSTSVAFMSISANLLQLKLGLNPKFHGLFLLVATSFYLIVNLLNRWFLRFSTLEQLIKIGVNIGVLAGFLFFIFASMGILNIYTVAIPMILFNIAAGLTFANCVAKALIPFPQQAGSASALLGFVQIITGCLSTLLMAHFVQKPQLSFGIYYFIAMLLAFGSIYKIANPKIFSVTESLEG